MCACFYASGRVTSSGADHQDCGGPGSGDDLTVRQTAVMTVMAHLLLPVSEQLVKRVGMRVGHQQEGLKKYYCLSMGNQEVAGREEWLAAFGCRASIRILKSTRLSEVMVNYDLNCLTLHKRCDSLMDHR